MDPRRATATTPALNLPRDLPLDPARSLLLTCGRRTLDAAARIQLNALLDGPMDWPAVERQALRHGLLPLLYAHLRTLPAGRVPAPVLARLAARSAAIAHEGLRLTGELRRILRALDAARIPVAALKGPALAQSAYGSIGLRHFGDLDLLVRPRDIERAAEVLVALGYDGLVPRWRTYADISLRSGYDYPFVSASNVEVELHHRLTLPCFQSAAAVDGLFERMVDLPIAGMTVRTLGPEDAFVYLCVHGAKHIWERLEWICTLAELARGGAIQDWSSVVARARVEGNERMVAGALLLAESLALLRLPDEIAGAVRRDGKAVALAERALRGLRRDAPEQESGERFLYVLHSHGWRNRWRYGWFLLTTPSLGDAAAIRLPRSLWFLYGLARPPRIAARYAATVLRALVAGRAGRRGRAIPTAPEHV